MNANSKITGKIFLLARLLKKKVDIVFSKFGLTVKTYEILTLIEAELNTSTQLAKRMNLQLAGITQKTKMLEKKGFISREIKKEDMRIWKFVLTQKGKNALQKITPINMQISECLYSSFSKADKDKMLANLTEVIEQLQRIKDEQVKDFF